jgi:hypothetical protein
VSGQPDLVRLLALITSVLLLALVIELVRRRKLIEEYALVWLVGTSALLVLSLSRELLHRVAAWLGVFYPPAVLLLVLILFGYLAALYFSVVTSQHRRQIARLVEDLAIVSAELRELRESLDAAARRDTLDAAARPEPPSQEREARP